VLRRRRLGLARSARQAREIVVAHDLLRRRLRSTAARDQQHDDPPLHLKRSPSLPSSSSGKRHCFSSSSTVFAACAHGATASGFAAQSFITIVTLSATSSSELAPTL